MIYYGTHLSDNLSLREPEGYLLCLNVPVARTGFQDYLPEELDLPPSGAPIPVFRPPEEVFSPECIASFEGMPVTNDHPPGGVNLENIRRLGQGHAQNIGPGGRFSCPIRIRKKHVRRIPDVDIENPAHQKTAPAIPAGAA